MAINISYDPSDDPQAIAEAEARDAESLELGEQMIKDQQDLLAGKYKNAEELEKAYLELQQKFSRGETSNDDVTEGETVTEEVETTNAQYLDDGGVNYDTVKEFYGDQLANVFQEAEIDPWEMDTHFKQNGGTLTDEMYDRLNKAGFSDATIDAYLAGIRVQMGLEEQQTAPELTDREVATIKNIAGGEKAYDQMIQWASENLDAEDIEAFDDVVNTGNKSAIRLAVKALMGQYEDAVGRDSSLVTGKQPTANDAYRSMAEVVRDMQDPRYDQDDAYRMDVMRKLERSNLQV
jgi:hypothetical protein